MQQQSEIRFEIRKGIKGAHKHNAMIQAGYDATDRMANLLGHITFAEMLGQTFDDLIPRIVPHVARCAEYGLIDEPEKVIELLNRLQRYNGKDSFASLVDRICDDDDAEFPKQARAAVYQLWFQHGIRLPEIAPRLSYMLEVRQGMRELTEYAGDLSYRAIWETPMVKDMKTAKIAIRRAFDRNVINLPLNNGYCCSSGTCTLGLSTDMCYLYHGVCVTGSSYCANHLSAMDADSDCGCC